MTPEFLAEDQRPAARIAISFVTAIALVVVCVRIWVRHRMMGEFGWDDGFICGATVRHVPLLLFLSLCLCLIFPLSVPVSVYLFLKSPKERKRGEGVVGVRPFRVPC